MRRQPTGAGSPCRPVKPGNIQSSGRARVSSRNRMASHGWLERWSNVRRVLHCSSVEDYAQLRGWADYGVVMFVAVQIPLADLRHFVPEQTGRLRVPPWPLADPARHFVRAVGPVRRRRGGGVEGWPGESLYCEARRAVIFPAEHGNLTHEGSQRIHLTPLYRRFLATGEPEWPGTIARMDFGFNVSVQTTKRRARGRELPSLEEAALAAITVALNVPGHNRPLKLLNAGVAVAEMIRTATTSLTDLPERVHPWWVQAGRLLVLIETPLDPHNTSLVDSLKRSRTVRLQHKDQLDFLRFSHVHSDRVPLWTIFRKPDVHSGELRRIRTHLWRLHNEREVLGKVLAECLSRNIDPSREALRDYLARQSERLRKKEIDGLPQAEFLSRAYAEDELVNADRISELRQILRGVNKGVARSVTLLVGIYIDESITHEIETVASSGRFNYEKLLKLINELNDNYSRGNVYAAHALLRALLDHIPPMLNCDSFNSVVNNYHWGRSDTAYMNGLRKYKFQMDDVLHRQISSTADLLRLGYMPPPIWVNRLLQECVERANRVPRATQATA